MEMLEWGKVKQALADALEAAPEARQALLKKMAPSMRVAVERLLNASDEADGFIEKPAVLEQGLVTDLSVEAPAEVDEYRILEQIGDGGMGTVYLAERRGDGFAQRVAIKLIKRGMDSSAILDRFLTERRILASLDHPNIARLIDGGSTPEGIPYFVMEYVEGQEIRKHANTHALGLNARLELFQKVCAAVSSAHQKLVVHRDIKPNNILVTRDGEPKLLDFGIAKLLSPDTRSSDENTVTQFRVLTPEYASPEQIAGRSTTTATDVYSLGVVLYELLTGQRPFRTHGKDPAPSSNGTGADPIRPSLLAFESIRSQSATKNASPDTAANGGEQTLRSIDPHLLRGDLDNIVLKAVRHDPERRYQSVNEMSEDISRFLEGMPVKATADSRWYRFRKFFDRNRPLVLAGSFAALLLIAATGVTLWQYSVARRERAVAERRFADTRKLAKSMLYDLHDKIAKLPGSTEAREYLVSQALEYLEQLNSEKIDDPELKSELADAYVRIGDIQGKLNSANLGELGSAAANYEKALKIREELAEKYPYNAKYKWKLAGSYATLAETAGRNVDKDALIKYTELEFATMQPFPDAYPEDDNMPKYLAAKLDSYQSLTALRLNQGEFDDALRLAREGVEIRAAASARFPDNTGLARYGEIMQGSLARAYSTSNRFDEALAIYYAALAKEPPEGTSPTSDRSTVVDLLQIADNEIGAGRFEKAISAAVRARDLGEKLAKADVKNAEIRMVNALVENLHGKALQKSGKNAEAVQVLDRAAAEWKTMRDASPDDHFLADGEAFCKGYLGAAYLGIAKHGRDKLALQNARRNLEEAVAFYDGLRTEGVLTPDEKVEADEFAARLEECKRMA